MTKWLRYMLFITGLFWFGRSILEFSGPNYWDPRTTLDYVVVVGTSLRLFFLAVVLWGLLRQNPLTPKRAQKVWELGMWLAIISSAVVGVSNFVEDALGFKSFGFLFVTGSIGALFGLLVAAIGAFLIPNIRKLGWFMLICFVGFYDYGGLIAGPVVLMYGWKFSTGAQGKNSLNLSETEDV